MTPPRNVFGASPSTLVIERPDGEELWIGARLSWEPESDIPVVINNLALGEIRWFPCDALEEDAPLHWSGTLWTEGPATGPKITVRPTLESDAISAVSMSGMPSVPMPLAVLAAIHASDGVFNMPTLWAMSDDDGFVATMMLNTDQGLYVRAAAAWHQLADEDVVDGLGVTEVEDSALDLFDQFDRAGQLPHVSAMPAKDGSLSSYPTPAVETDDAAASTESLIAAATRGVPLLSSAEDLPAAIEMAEDDPDLQWWVERRAKALGLEASFPWT